MKKKGCFLVICVLIAVVLFFTCTGIGSSPQFSEMPEGPLKSYSYTINNRVSEGTMLDIRLWHDENGQGIMSWDGIQTPAYVPENTLGESVPIGEEVFDTLYQILKDAKFYQLESHYDKTYFVDAYAFPAWDLKATFPNDSIVTHSDGKEADMESDDFNRPYEYLEKVYSEALMKYLPTAPVDLTFHLLFAHQGVKYVSFGYSEDNDSIFVYKMTEASSEDELGQVQLAHIGPREYRNIDNGDIWELHWVGFNLTVFCRSAKGNPLWAAIEYDENNGGLSDEIIEQQNSWLQRAKDGDFDWLRESLLDSYLVQRFSPELCKQMLSVVESSVEPTPQEKWNALMLRSFAP
jgi:hypothetical protein